MLIKQTRTGEGREGVTSVLLGRGASDEKVDHWLQQAAPVEGFIGFAIGRSIWWDALKGFLDERPRARRAAAEQVADNYLRFIKVYDDAESAARGLAATSRPRRPGARLASGADVAPPSHRRLAGPRRRGLHRDGG